jgi:TolB-like protein/tetratricopeptide (TPR) repeat protein
LSLFNELKRRNVFRVGIAYIVMAWLVLQVSDVILNNITAPGWVFHVLLLFLAIGFPFAVFFAWAFELTPEGLKKEKDVDRSKSITRVTGRKLDYVMIAVLVLALGYFTFDKFVLDPSRDAELVQATTEAVAEQATESGKADAADKSIAVLPFVNMSNDPEQEYFSDGISEELLNVLAQFPGLQVAARTSAFQFKGQNRDIAGIAQQLHVNHVLEGSVRKSGNRLRITAQLIDAESGFHLWSETYDRELDDIFAIQDEISAAIGDALKIELKLGIGEHGVALPSIPAASTALAYEYYLKGRQLMNQRSRNGLEEAVTALERSLELDERYAPSHAQLAIAITLLRKGGGSYGDFSMEEVLVRAMPHVDRAFELNANLAEAFAAKSLIANFQGNYPESLKNSEKALALNPSYVDVINWRYITFMYTGQWTQASEIMDHMMAVDPLSIIGQMNYVALLARTGRFEEAERAADELEKLNSRASLSIRALVSAESLGELTNSSRWYLMSLVLDSGNSFNLLRLAINFAAIREFEEARHLAPDFDWWVNAVQQRWNASIAQARQRLLGDPGDSVSRLQLANVLHMSGDLATAQPIYEELLVSTGGYAIIDTENTSVMPTARMAYGRLAAGDSIGAKEILELVKRDILWRKQAGIYNSYMLRAAAMVAAIEGDREKVLASLSAAIDAGLRADFMFREPAMVPYAEDPDFQALAARLDAILEEERRNTLQLICFNNPASEVWQPLPETCEGVEESI